MTKKIYNILIIIVFSLFTINATQDKEPYKLDTPNDWRKEIINFPLDFAPNINYKGFEELRFAPGMFKPGSNTYFTYIFVWYLDGNETITSGRLEKDLNTYFIGLCDAVGKSRKLTMDLKAIKSAIKEHSVKESEKNKYQNFYQGTVKTFDPFSKGEAIDLNVEVAKLATSKKDKTVLFFCVSTKPVESNIWKQLLEIRENFSIN